MAVTITPVLAGVDTYIATVTASAGSDLSSGDITHGLNGVPLDVQITPVTADAAGVPVWAATTISATKVILTRDATGAAASTVRVVIRLPHSIGK